MLTSPSTIANNCKVNKVSAGRFFGTIFSSMYTVIIPTATVLSVLSSFSIDQDNMVCTFVVGVMVVRGPFLMAKHFKMVFSQG